VPRRNFTPAEKDALLAQGEPFIVAPREVVKTTAAYQTDPEILLGCIIVSGTLDTAAVLSTDQNLYYRVKIEDADRAAYDTFRRVWQSPIAEERSAVCNGRSALQRPAAARIAAVFNGEAQASGFP
jgi:hypothetical protein